MTVGALELPGQRTSVGEERHPAARERRPGEVAREALDPFAQLLVASRDHGGGGGQPEPLGELGEPILVVKPGEGLERSGEENGALGQRGVAGRQVEGLLERGHDELDLVLAHNPLDIGDERLRLGARGGSHEVPREVARMATGRDLVAVGGIQVVAARRQLSHHVERERQPGARDQDPHRAHSLHV
jgi:hypothetical protein